MTQDHKKDLRNRTAAFCSAIASVSLAAFFVAPPPASADTMRTFNLALTCATGEPYALLISTSNSGWYTPDYSSYAVGTTKYYSVQIPASATSIEYEPTYCDNEPSAGGYNADFYGYNYSIVPGTSTISANGYCNDYDESFGFGVTILIYADTLSSITYS